MGGHCQTNGVQANRLTRGRGVFPCVLPASLQQAPQNRGAEPGAAVQQAREHDRMRRPSSALAAGVDTPNSTADSRAYPIAAAFILWTPTHAAFSSTPFLVRRNRTERCNRNTRNATRHSQNPRDTRPSYKRVPNILRGLRSAQLRRPEQATLEGRSRHGTAER